jgi:hypothetical protein
LVSSNDIMQTFVFLLLLAAQPGGDLIRRYVEAIGGEEALRAVRTRVTTGEFNNGRGLVTPFRIVEQTPNRRVTLIGPHPIDGNKGSGRGFDGAAGWDKNFIGTGLRSVEGQELADLQREADLLRPLHLLDGCGATGVETAGDRAAIVCSTNSHSPIRFYFDGASGLLVEEETAAVGGGSIRVLFEDYRAVDGLRLPFRTRIVLPGATITYTAAAIRHNEPVQESAFQRPAR